MGLETKAQIKAAILQGRTQIANDLGIILPNILGAMVDSYVDFNTQNVASVADPAFGAVNNGTGDNSPAFANAIAAVAAKAAAVGQVGGVVFVPSGDYVLRTGVTVPDGIWLVGASPASVYLHDGGANLAPVVTMSGNNARLQNLSILGCGGSVGEPVPPAFPAVLDTGTNEIFECTILYGSFCVDCVNAELKIADCFLSNGYSTAVIHVGNNTKIKASRVRVYGFWPTSAPAIGSPLNPPNWAANTVTAVGALVLVGNVLLQCTAVTGDARTGSVAPPAATTPYFTDLVDNHVTWNTVWYTNNVGYFGIYVQSNAASLYLDQCEFNGSLDVGIFLESGANILCVTDSEFVQGMRTASVGLSSAQHVTLKGNRMFGGYAGSGNAATIWLFSPNTIDDVLISDNRLDGQGNTTASVVEMNAAPSGALIVSNNRIVNAINGVGVFGGGNLVVSTNSFGGCTNSINIGAGPVDHYALVNNLLGGGALVDGGTGTHKTVTGNVT